MHDEQLSFSEEEKVRLLGTMFQLLGRCRSKPEARRAFRE
jgi:hypothetical protein